MLIVRATRKLTGLVDRPDLSDDDRDTTRLGPWYATVLPWRSRVTLLVNEATLLPVLARLAPAAGWRSRIAADIATVLAAHAVPTAFIDVETQQMRDTRIGPTANRSVVGIMNEFSHLAEAHRSQDRDPDLLDLSLRLSRTPCGPLYGKNISPDRELAAALRSHR